MTVPQRPLRRSKAPSAAEAAARALKRARNRPRVVTRWTEENVIALLNRETNAVTRRIAEIVEAFREAIRLAEQIIHYSEPGTKDYRTLKDQQSDVLNDINGFLDRYKWSVAVYNSPSSDSYFQIPVLAGPNPILHPASAYPEDVDFNTPSGAELFENRAVQWLVENVSLLHRIRRCHRPQCRKWYFAVTDHQKYCGVMCRKRNAEQGESFKEKRRAYMRKYRGAEAERNERAKRLVRGKANERL